MIIRLYSPVLYHALDEKEGNFYVCIDDGYFITHKKQNKKKTMKFSHGNLLGCRKRKKREKGRSLVKEKDRDADRGDT